MRRGKLRSPISANLVGTVVAGKVGETFSSTTRVTPLNHNPNLGLVRGSRFGILVAQMYSITALARQQPPKAHLCFPFLTELISAIDEDPKETVLHWQNKCKNALLLLLGKGPLRSVRHLASLAMVKIFEKGGGTPKKSRAWSLQGLQAESKRSGTMPCAWEAIIPCKHWPI